MGSCASRPKASGLSHMVAPWPADDPIPQLQKELSKDMKRVMGSAIFTQAKIRTKLLTSTDLSKAYDFVELQMLLPRRHCIDTQVLVLTAAQLACCGMLLQQPSPNNQSSYVQNVCLHILFEMRPLQLEAHGVALANLARSLEGNTNLEKLNLNLMGITLMSTTSMAKKVFANVMETFATMLCCNTTLRLLRFEGMMGGDEEVPWSEEDAEVVCKAQASHRARLRMAFLMGQHPKSKQASPITRDLPRDLARRILDLAVPMHPLCKVEFDFFRDEVQLEDFTRYV